MDLCKRPRCLIKVFKKGKLGEFYNIGSNKNLNNFKIIKYLLKIAKPKIIIGKMSEQNMSKIGLDMI